MPICVPSIGASKVAIRPALPTEGALVQHLFSQCSETPCDWLVFEDVYPHWLIGEVEGVPSGICMVGFGRPFGWIECLMVLPTLSTVQKARLTTLLGDAAYDLLRLYGAQGAVCTVSDETPNFQRIVTRRGFIPVGHGAIYLKRLI